MSAFDEPPKHPGMTSIEAKFARAVAAARESAAVWRALDDVAQVRVLIKVAPSPTREGLLSGQAIAQFVQAPLYTVELCVHARLL